MVDETENAYVFEKSLQRTHHDGNQTTVSADLYKRGCFILETKQGVAAKGDPKAATDSAVPVSSVKQEAAKYSTKRTGHGRRGTRGWDVAMVKAFNQSRLYIRDLPAEEGRPPFLIVVDVGYSIELYSEFTCSGGRYVAFPDPRSHRILLDDLRDPEVRERLRLVWTDPISLDPAKRTARVTREIADRLARLAKTFENSGHDPQTVAEFLMRCIFTMFAEDIGLLPRESFTELLKNLRGNEQGVPAVLRSLWNDMEKGSDFSVALKSKVLHFNGGLFESADALPLDADQLELMIESAEADWREVEPAIFGTLLERALDPRERHKLGAHYTPRTYVERLVFPTVIDPLREEWDGVKAASIQLRDSDSEGAIQVVKDFHHKLCGIRVLDPACGSANFLYVTMEHMKRLEGEVLEALEELGDPELTFEMGQFKVRPHQFLGLEINPRAVPIAELVLQIGYLQWHFRTSDKAVADDPVIAKQRSILHQDAVLAYDEKIPLLDEEGKAVTHWDGRTTKTHPVTGKEVPDESARTPVFEYVNPRKAEWPEADYVVGNPPFIGNKRMRTSLTGSYVSALRDAWGDLPKTGDFVMYWWEAAARLSRAGSVSRFGLITTKSIGQVSNRVIVEPHLRTEESPLYINFAIPNHPWIDAAAGASVRIAMTVASCDDEIGLLIVVEKELNKPKPGGGDDLVVRTSRKRGRIHPDLKAGPDLTSADGLKANDKCSFMGVTLVGDFEITQLEAESFRSDHEANPFLRPFTIGEELAQKSMKQWVIDFDDISTPEEAERVAPQAYQHLLNVVKPHRDLNARRNYRENWWIFGESRPGMRTALRSLERYIATPETSEHRFFLFLESMMVADHSTFIFPFDDAFFLGVLSSPVHEYWTIGRGGRMGVGNQTRYRNTECFETFPFPTPPPALESTIRDLGERLDAHRKRQQAAHPDLTMTGMYNVLEKLRREQPLTDKERVIHDNGLVSVLKQIHDDLDAAVLEAYGWSDLITDSATPTIPLADQLACDGEVADALEEAILERLVALNHERAEEEAKGQIRWLRPDFQNPQGDAEPESTATQSDLPGTDTAKKKATKKTAKTKAKKSPWPKTLPEQITAVRDVLNASTGPVTPAQIAQQFTRANKTRLAEVLETLTSLGHATESNDGEYTKA